MQNKVWIRKQGNVETAFIDMANGQSLPLANFEDEPVGGFPFTCSEGQMRAKFQGAEFIIFEQQRPAQPHSAPVSDKEVADVIGSRAVTRPEKQTLPMIGRTEQALTNSQTQIVAQLQLQFARYSESTGKRRGQLKIELEGICRFLLAIDGNFGPILEKLKASLDQPQFNL